jgi:hypothetical protein
MNDKRNILKKFGIEIIDISVYIIKDWFEREEKGDHIIV